MFSVCIVVTLSAVLWKSAIQPAGGTPEGAVVAAACLGMTPATLAASGCTESATERLLTDLLAADAMGSVVRACQTPVPHDQNVAGARRRGAAIIADRRHLWKDLQNTLAGMSAALSANESSRLATFAAAARAGLPPAFGAAAMNHEQRRGVARVLTMDKRAARLGRTILGPEARQLSGLRANTEVSSARERIELTGRALAERFGTSNVE